LAGRPRIAVMTAMPDGTDLAPEIADALDSVVSVLSNRGYPVVEAVPPALAEEEITEHFGRVVAVEIEQLARAIEHEIQRPLLDQELAPRNQRRRELGRQLSATAYLASRNWLAGWAYRFGAWWNQDADLLLSPTLGGPVAPVGDPTDDAGIEQRSRLMRPLTAFVNVAGSPAISLPLAIEPDGTPIGMQFVAPIGHESKLLAIAEEFERDGPWHAGPASFSAARC